MELRPRAQREVGIWLKIKENLIDNFIPLANDLDCTRLAYECEPETEYREPCYPVDDWNGFHDVGIIAWPEAMMERQEVARNGGQVIGLVNTDDLIGEDAEGQERTARITAEPNDWLQTKIGLGLSEDDPGFMPEGVGGWLDDLDNGELAAALLTKEPNTRFVDLIEQGDVPNVPCKGGTIAAALFRNLEASNDGRIASIFVTQAQDIAAAGLGFYQTTLDHIQALLDRN